MKHSLWMMLGAGLLVLGGAGLAAAEAVTADEIIQLSQKGLGEDVLLAKVEHAEGGFTLSVEQIIKLKQAGVSEKVIAAMLRKKPVAAGAQIAPRAPAPNAAPAAPAAAEAGTLNLENVDDRPWAYRLDPDARLLWISRAGAADEHLLPPHGGVSLAPAAGAYEVRYVGENAGTLFRVEAGQKSLLLVSRVETEEFEGLYVSVFEKGERKAGGRLAILRQTRRGAQPQANYQYVPPKTPEYTQEQPRPAERVVVEEPATTVIYRTSPVYVSPYYPYYPSYPYSYRSPWGYGYPYNYGSFRWSSGHRHSGFSVGIGVGF